jgi:hypothetical protein
MVLDISKSAFMVGLAGQALILLFKQRADLQQRPYFHWRETRV